MTWSRCGEGGDRSTHRGPRTAWLEMEAARWLQGCWGLVDGWPFTSWVGCLLRMVWGVEDASIPPMASQGEADF